MLATALALVATLAAVAMAQSEQTRHDRDTATIKSTIEAIGVFADFGHFESMCELFADVSEFDYSSLWGNEATTGDPSDRATGWSGFIPGFDVTRHDIRVVDVTVSGPSASARAKVVADHWLDGDRWTISGLYDVSLTREGDRWLIHRWVFSLLDEHGDRRLVDEAEVRAAGAVERPIRCTP